MVTRYLVTHRTRYGYAEPVRLCHNQALLTPRPLAGQRTRRSRITVEPEPAFYHQWTDLFGNTVTYFAVQQPHTVLEVLAESEIELDLPATADGLDRQPADNLATFAPRDRIFALDTPLVPLEPAFAEYAAKSFPAGIDPYDGVVDFTGRMFRDFVFDPHFSTVATPVRTVFEQRRGVCQDFAHLALGCLRGVGLLCRYVSGYLETVPPEGAERLVGADASHAWIAVFFPGRGWVDFDPTNGLIVTDRHITLAWGRDYSDVPPLRGVVQGGGEHTLEVAVDVLPLRESAPSGPGSPPGH